MDAQITRQPIRISRWMKYIVVISVVAVLYVITARLGLSLALPPEGKATSVWPPSGIALAAVLIVGCRVWPGIWLGAFLGNFWDYFEPTSQFSLSSHLWVSSGIAVGSTLQPLLGTYLIRRLMGRQNPLDSARNVFQFLGSALLMCLVASTVGVTLLFSTGFSAWTNLGFNWLTWWLGDLMGILVVTPLALTWRQAPDFLMSPRRMAEAGLLLMVLLGVGLLNFGGWGPWGIDSRFLLYLTVPPLVWAALRFGRHGATVALLVVLGIAVWGTAHQRGPWVMPTLNESLILLQTFMGVLAVTTLTLASVLTERQRGEAALKESRERLRLAQQAGRIGVWDWNVLSGELVRDGAEPMDGLDHKSLGESLETYLQNVHSQDREALINAVNQAVEHGGELDQEYRIVWPDASIHWAHAKGHALQDDQGRTVRLTGTCEDITRRKELEEAAEKLQGEIVRGVEAQLKETREMFYSLFEFAPDAILVVNESGVIIRVNSKTEQLFGYSREELAGQAVELLVPHRFAREHVGHRSQYLQDPNTRPMGVGLQLFGRPKDGTEFPVDIMLSPFDTKEGRMVRATIRDVTERKRAEEELGFQGQIIRDMAEGVNVVRADDGIIIYTNPKFEEMFGYGPGELIGRSVSILNTPGEKSPEQVVEEITTVLERGEVWKGEIHTIKKDGTPFWCYANISAFAHHEYQNVWISTQTDITERKAAEVALWESETRFRSLVESANAAIVIADQEGRIVSWNRGAVYIFGYAPEDILDQPISILMPERYHEAHESALDRVRVTGKGTLLGKTLEFHGLRNDGTEFPVEFSVSSWQTGSRRFFSSIIYDITERRAAEEQIREALRREVLLKEEIHHRVKNNLQVVNSLLYLESIGAAEQATREILRDCQSRIKAIALIHEKLYRSEDIERVDFTDYGTDLVSDLIRTYDVHSTDVAVHTDFDKVSLGVDTAVPCGLIMNELIANVFKHAFVDGAKGDLWIKMSQLGDKAYMLTVRDNGVGLPEGFSLETASSLGMKLVRDLIRQLEGTLAVEGDKGTTIHATFRESKYRERW